MGYLAARKNNGGTVISYNVSSWVEDINSLMDFHVLRMLRLNKKNGVDIYVSIGVQVYEIKKRLTNSIYRVIIF